MGNWRRSLFEGGHMFCMKTKQLSTAVEHVPKLGTESLPNQNAFRPYNLGDLH